MEVGFWSQRVVATMAPRSEFARGGQVLPLHGMSGRLSVPLPETPALEDRIPASRLPCGARLKESAKETTWNDAEPTPWRPRKPPRSP